MFSPEMIPNKRRVNKPRNCRRQLYKNFDDDNSKKDEASTSDFNLTEEDFSADESDYIPEADPDTDSSIESTKVLPHPKKRAMMKITKDAEYVREDSPVLRSIFSTPTSSKLASCVPSPLLNEVSSLVNLSNVDEFFDNLDIDHESEKENMNLEMNQPNYTEEDHNIQHEENVIPHESNISTISTLSNLALSKINDVHDEIISNQHNAGEYENQNDRPVAEILSENNDNNLTEQENDTNIGRSRKKSRDEAKWKDKLNKRLKNSGEAYVGARNNIQRNKKVIGQSCNCKKECFKKISSNERLKIFETFWKIGDHERQWEYILRNISSQSIKRMQLERKSKRSQTIIYMLPINQVERVVVCKKMFLGTLGITEKWVYTAIEKQEGSIIDLRGSHSNRPRKMTEITKQSVINHINQFPVVDSHYTRRDSSKLYLNETLNLSKMYRFYKVWYEEQTDMDRTNMASKAVYETIFNTRFNYSFFKPKKDLCDTCFIYANADEERKSQLKETYDAHIQEKVAARSFKNNEKVNSDPNKKSVACFDLEKVLYVPQSEVSQFYYKRKYAVYNFTVYDVLLKKGFCYVWHQQIAKRGAIEISSCLWYYIIHEIAQKGKTEISFYSDSCTGQNRNRFVFSMYQHASRVYGIDVCHRFFEKGHSQSEGDTMHACVERAKKNHIIYTPEQMYCIISNAKVEGEKFSVKEMLQSDFYDFKQLVNRPDVNWFQDDAGEKVFWSKVKEVRIKHTDPDKIIFKYSLLETSEEKSLTTTRVSSRRRRRRGNSAQPQDEMFNLATAYAEPIPITRPLFKDLMELCDSGAIPPHYHDFYKGLVAQNVAQGQQADSGDSE